MPLLRFIAASLPLPQAAVALSAEQGYAQWLAQGTILQGWALTEQGQGAKGITQIHQGLAALQAIGVETVRPYFLALLAEAYGRGGQVEEGLSVLAEALAGVNKTGVCYYEAELYRLKGELLLDAERGMMNSSRAVPRPPFSI